MKKFSKMFFKKLKLELTAMLWWVLIISVSAVISLSAVILLNQFGLISIPIAIVIFVVCITFVDTLEEYIKNKKGK